GNDANVRRRETQDFRQGAMHVMRRLRRAPQRQLVVSIEVRHRRVLFERQMRVALIKKDIFADVIGFIEAFGNIAEFERHALMNVAGVAVVVYARLINVNAFFNRRDGLEPFVFDFDQIHRLERRVFVNSGDSGNRVANHTDFIDAERVFVLADRQYAVRNRQIASGNDGYNSGELERAGYVDAFDESVRHGTTQQLAKKHSRQSDVVGKARLAIAFCPRIDFAKRFADYFFRFPIVAVTHTGALINLVYWAPRITQLTLRVRPIA